MPTTDKPATPPSVIQSLSAVMSEVQAVRKGQRNTEQGYNFRGIDDVVNTVGPVLRKHGVIVLPILEEANHRDVLTSKEKKSRESTVRVRYRFYGPAGDHIEAVVPGEAMDFGDKGVAKAMSVAYRIVLLQALCIPTDEPDADSQTYERVVEPQWDPVDQEILEAGWKAEIAKAGDDAELQDIAEKIKAVRGKTLSPTKAATLYRDWAARKAELDKAKQDVPAEVPA